MKRHLQHRLLTSTVVLAGCSAMARQPTMPESDYQRIVELLAREGYDMTQIQKVPQRWARNLAPRGIGRRPLAQRPCRARI